MAWLVQVSLVLVFIIYLCLYVVHFFSSCFLVLRFPRILFNYFPHFPISLLECRASHLGLLYLGSLVVLLVYSILYGLTAKDARWLGAITSAAVIILGKPHHQVLSICMNHMGIYVYNFAHQ